MKLCRNCGAEIEECDAKLRHKRTNAFHCDLDDPDSLVAEASN